MAPEHKQTMITYSPALPEHMEGVARLHALSWQVHYRGIFYDHYLDHQVIDDRLEVWKRRFENPSKDQYVVLALDEQLLCGFGCVYLNHSPEYGALIDNLHVHPDWQGKGIGKGLMQQCCHWVTQKDPQSSLYLWVLEENQQARNFYLNLGGAEVEKIVEHNPGGGTAEVLRIIWNRAAMLAN